MGRSHKERPPIKATTLRPLLNDQGPDEESGLRPIVGRGDPMTNEEASEHSGAGVRIGNQAEMDKPIGAGPGDDVPEGDGGIPNAKP